LSAKKDVSSNPFWEFSLTHYAKAPVQKLCLQLQEQAGANVNVVLFTLWLARLERTFETDVVAGNTELLHWHEQVTVPLRQARGAIKHCHQQTSALYAAVKKAELDAERVEQDMLCELLPLFHRTENESPVRTLAEHNVQVYLRTLPLGAELLGSVVRRLVKAAF